MKKLIVFDLDGTLINSLKDLWTAVNGALSVAGLPCRSEDEVRRFVGDGVDMLIRRAIGERQDMFAECKAAFKRIYDEGMKKATRPYGGVQEMLSGLRAAGLKIAVLSNKYDSAAKEICACYFGDKVDTVVGQKDGVKVKPDPTALLALLKDEGVSADETLYCGDGEADVKCAAAAGVDMIAATWGFRSRSALEEAGAKTFADSPAEVTDLASTF